MGRMSMTDKSLGNEAKEMKKEERCAPPSSGRADLCRALLRSFDRRCGRRPRREHETRDHGAETESDQAPRVSAEVPTERAVDRVATGAGEPESERSNGVDEIDLVA